MTNEVSGTHSRSQRAPLLLTVEDAAQALRVSRSKMFILIGNGDVESVKVGRARRIPAGALEEYVNRLRHGTQAVA